MTVKVKAFTELTIQELYEILALRNEIFVVEQQCPYQDIDHRDQEALHVMGWEGDVLKAYLRVFRKSEEEAAIGRVLAAERRRGYASEVLRAGIAAAKEYFGMDRIYLEAQTYAKSLYEKQGFIRCGEEFLEDGIPHIPMRKS